MLELLAALSASAAVGMRIALPLLVIGLLQGEFLWSTMPVIGRIHPPVVLGVLVSWSLFEVFAATHLLGQRILQIVELFCSPLIGALMGMAVAEATGLPSWLVNLLGIVGGLLALVLQLVQAGWFYKLRGLPLWATLLQDFLCIALVFFAFDAPREGGLIALLLLWIAIRSSAEWRRWYYQQARRGDRHHPRRHKSDPD
ncbi:MAG: DUF4126 domain-containing protein [Leptolyngbyaceae bacterium]|nr:DUF4126 domain-containing protein [Leptolyngbyaceae bacterium]